MTLITSAGTWCLKHTLHLPSHDPPHASPHASPPPLLDIHPVDPCPVSCFVLSAGPGFPLVSLPPFPHSLPSLTRASSSSSSFFHPLSNPRYHSRTSYTNPHVSVHARISPSRPPILLFSSSLCLCVVRVPGFGCQALSIVYTLCDGYCISTSTYLDFGPS